jgi:hypothetical protein
MNERPTIRKPTASETRSAERDTGKRHPVHVRATFVRLARQPGISVT